MRGFFESHRGLCRTSLSGLLLALTVFAVGACGKKPGGGGGGRALGKVEQAFLQASAETGVPVRFLLAAGFSESQLVPANASASYVSLTDSEEPVARGTALTQTAFGLTYETLGLDPAKEESAVLEVQVAAYARWLAATLQEHGVTLAANPRSAEEKFYWIENLALLHRQGIEGRRATQVLFGYELVEVLNQGFVWQDPDRNGEILRLDPEFPAIDIDGDFPQSGKNWFDLRPEPGLNLNTVPYLRLATMSSNTVPNKPRGIRVIHCPLSLSGCLDLQTRSQDGDASVGSYVYLSAHYVIPAEAEHYGSARVNAVQLVPHNEAVTVTDNLGKNEKVQDAIVIMLTGNSGRTVDGTRQPAIPTWFRSSQLQTMATLVNDICTRLSQKDNEDPVDRDVCMGTDGDNGVRFRHQGKSEEYRWGDIADFDATIFEAYLRNSGGLMDEVAFELSQGNRQFVAGTALPLTVLFNSTARSVQLERLNRCADGKLVWELVRNQQVKGQNRAIFAETFFDSGPNRNGEQYFRARVYGKDTMLQGWSIEKVNLSGFDPEPQFASEAYCQ